MKLTAKLAFSQIKVNRSRTMWTLMGIALSTSMITAICGLLASANKAFTALLGDNYYDRGLYLSMLIGIGAVLCLIIITASVIVISNAFRVSAGVRTQQFGILKSVGATKKQIAATVMYEGLWLSAIGIPAGIVVGLLLEFFCTSIANYLLAGINKINNVKVEFSFVVAWQALIIAAIAAFVTVLLSAWLPARKASKIAAIDAIRNTGEVKLSAKKIRTNKLTAKLFGAEGTLAAKSLKRNKRNLRATVVSLTISIVLFLAASSLGVQIGQLTQIVFPTINATAVATFSTSVHYAYVSEDGQIGDVRYSAIDTATQQKVTERLQQFDASPLFAVGSLHYGFEVTVPEEMVTEEMRPKTDYPLSLITVDSAHYAELCKKAGVPLGSNILINHESATIDNKKYEFEPFVFNHQTLNIQKHDGTTRELTLDGALTVGEIPAEIMMEARGLSVIVPETEAQNFYWFTDTENAEGFAEFAVPVLNEEIRESGDIGITRDALDIRAATEAVRSTVRLIMVFIYSFVGMLTLIGLTNVISTISTNIRSRSREFAVLKSVGMTQKGVGQMLNLESILCSAKALLYGLPLGIIAAVLVGNAISIAVEVVHSNRIIGPNSIIPWLAVLECILAVFVITWVTMRYSASRLKKGSIVDAIRAESGV
ncbi:MAG: ABC transporter permease [Oscillospiraceae bacterium]|jgi:putative ABC transport system permease protein|nr:ABC transporter permease [Oscillospiraceae bacterium]